LRDKHLYEALKAFAAEMAPHSLATNPEVDDPAPSTAST
jgi:hypothetical protein